MKARMGIKALGKMDKVATIRKVVISSVFSSAGSRVAGQVKREQVFSKGVIGDHLSYASCLLMLQGFETEIEGDTLRFGKVHSA